MTTPHSYQESLDASPESRNARPEPPDYPGDHLDRDDYDEDGEPILAELGDYADHGYRWAQEKERDQLAGSAPWWQKTE